jgi:hypothetical protein
MSHQRSFDFGGKEEASRTVEKRATERKINGKPGTCNRSPMTTHKRMCLRTKSCNGFSTADAACAANKREAIVSTQI